MSVYTLEAATPGALITALNRELNILVCTEGNVLVIIAKDAAGATPLFAIPSGVSTMAFTAREDIAGPLYAISAAAAPIVVNTWR
jgi:hypothetical protein